jgi:3-hydroxyisobutyrate dehydrogenase-like beta-hydroxyacid dehydrogenase
VDWSRQHGSRAYTRLFLCLAPAADHDARQGMVTNIVKKGNLSAPLLVFNRTQKRSDDLNAALGGALRVATTVADAVGPADIVFVCVGDDATIMSTFDIILKMNVADKLLVSCSTVHPDTVTELERKSKAMGARFVAMPVFGAPPAADAGQLVSVLAGPKADVDAIRPYTTGVYVPLLSSLFATNKFARQDRQDGDRHVRRLAG